MTILYQTISRLRPLHYYLGALLLGFLAVMVVEANTYYIRDLLYLDVYGSKPHRIPCEEWPVPNWLVGEIVTSSE